HLPTPGQGPILRTEDRSSGTLPTARATRPRRPALTQSGTLRLLPARRKLPPEQHTVLLRWRRLDLHLRWLTLRGLSGNRSGPESVAPFRKAAPLVTYRTESGRSCSAQCWKTRSHAAA